ncbi:MAG: flippase-like domain-containing protein [Acidobacteriota bacterium]|nr:flippase-like domain-containing protein [Acidobacteriota bacterium]
MLTVLGIALFSYFVYSVGVREILAGIGRIGFGGFALIILIYFLRIACRATAWRLSVSEPYRLDFSDTLPAVIIGEALSSLIPLGVLISGTSKAIAVRNRVPLVVGLSSVATENLFYSLVTGLFVAFGAFAFLRNFELPGAWTLTVDLLIFLVLFLIFFGFVMVIRQWHLLSSLCNWFYNRHIGRRILEDGRGQVRLFEDLIYGFYRQNPRRFLPILFFQIVFHALGITEVLFILSRISDALPSLYSAYLLESVSRVITIVFKLVPFLIGVDEAGAQFVAETLALGAGVGITLAIIRKGRILFWTAVGMILIVRRELSLIEILRHAEDSEK